MTHSEAAKDAVPTQEDREADTRLEQLAFFLALAEEGQSVAITWDRNASLRRAIAQARHRLASTWPGQQRPSAHTNAGV